MHFGQISGVRPTFGTLPKKNIAPQSQPLTEPGVKPDAFVSTVRFGQTVPLQGSNLPVEPLTFIDLDQDFLPVGKSVYDYVFRNGTQELLKAALNLIEPAFMAVLSLASSKPDYEFLDYDPAAHEAKLNAVKKAALNWCTSPTDEAANTARSLVLLELRDDADLFTPDQEQILIKTLFAAARRGKSSYLKTVLEPESQYNNPNPPQREAGKTLTLTSSNKSEAVNILIDTAAITGVGDEILYALRLQLPFSNAQHNNAGDILRAQMKQSGDPSQFMNALAAGLKVQNADDQIDAFDTLASFAVADSDPSVLIKGLKAITPLAEEASAIAFDALLKIAETTNDNQLVFEAGNLIQMTEQQESQAIDSLIAIADKTGNTQDLLTGLKACTIELDEQQRTAALELFIQEATMLKAPVILADVAGIEPAQSPLWRWFDPKQQQQKQSMFAGLTKLLNKVKEGWYIPEDVDTTFRQAVVDIISQRPGDQELDQFEAEFTSAIKVPTGKGIDLLPTVKKTHNGYGNAKIYTPVTATAILKALQGETPTKKKC